jgi:hypothetical protein
MLQVCVNAGHEFSARLAEALKDSVPEAALARPSYNAQSRILFGDFPG